MLKSLSPSLSKLSDQNEKITAHPTAHIMGNSQTQGIIHFKIDKVLCSNMHLLFEFKKMKQGKSTPHPCLSRMIDTRSQYPLL